MNRLLHRAFCGLLLIAAIAVQARADESKQLFEIRSYLMGAKSDAAAMDQYLSKALLPALARQTIGPVGVFTNAENDESGSQRIIVVIPYDSASDVVSVQKAVDADADYQAAAKEFLARKKATAAYDRVSSELLEAMDCWPKATVDNNSLSNSDRVYELRLYESPNRRLGNLKVHMFNNGEVPIFLDCGIKPIVMGQCVVGPQAPNLTYLTVYPNDEARMKAWDDFRLHPDWQVLKKVAKYKGTVSKIDKFILVAKPYSQM